MRDLLTDLEQWFSDGEPVALATVIKTWGSSPRQVGAKMAMTPSGNISGSVSGGCVEGAVYQLGVETIETGCSQLLHFGIADETAWEVGLACGGSIDVFVENLQVELFEKISAFVREGKPFVQVTIVRGPAHKIGQTALISNGEVAFSQMDNELLAKALSEAQSSLASGKSRQVIMEMESEQIFEIFIDSNLPPPKLVIIGGVHIAVALTKIAKVLGYETIVVDPRASFGNIDRFPDVGKLIQAWPDEALSQVELDKRTAVAVLTHDPKIDDVALKIVLDSPVFYIGVLGSRTTQSNRRKRLLETGVSEMQLDRLYAPIGIDIGGETPEEIALAVMAEVVATHRQVLS